jgi:hypothetical protein
MIDWKFNKYKFYTQGYNIGFLPEELTNKCRDVIKETNWIGTAPRFADWAVIPSGEEVDEAFYEELIRSRMSYGQAPTSIKNLANEIIDMKFFDPLRESLVKKQHQRYSSIRNIKPSSMGLWNKQLDVAMHNDVSDTSDFFILVYINPYAEWNESWGGQLNIGMETESGEVEIVHSHYPADSTFVVVNNTNPLFKHQVVSAGDKMRYTFGFRYVIE